MFCRALLYVLLLLRSFGAFHITDTGTKSEPAGEASSSKQCDLHMWYLDRVADGAFSGQMTPEQAGMKKRIETLIASTRGTSGAGLISCTILATFDNILSPGPRKGGGEAGGEDSAGKDSGDSKKDSSLTSGKKVEEMTVQDARQEGTGKENEHTDSTDVNDGVKNSATDKEDGSVSKISSSESDAESAKKTTEENETAKDVKVSADIKVSENDNGSDVKASVSREDIKKNTDASTDDLNTNKGETDKDDDGTVSINKDKRNITDEEGKDEATDKKKETDDGVGRKDDTSEDRDIENRNVTNLNQQKGNRSAENNQTSPRGQCTFTLVRECLIGIQRSRWSDYIFEPFIPPLTTSQTPKHVCTLAKCKTPVCLSRKSRKTARVSSKCCYYYRILNYEQHKINQTKMNLNKGSQTKGKQTKRKHVKPKMRTVAHIMKKMCQLSRKCSWQCFYGIQKQQCVQHYDLQFDTLQTTPTKDNGNRSENHNESVTHEPDDTEPREINDNEADESRSHEETTNDSASESDDRQSNPTDNKDETITRTNSDIFDETEIDSAPTEDKQAERFGEEKLKQKEEDKGEPKDTPDFNPEKQNAEHKTHENVQTEKERDIKSEPQEDRRNGNSRTSHLTEEELLRIEAMLQRKASEQAVKVQSLEIMIMKLENHILNQKLKEQNGTSHLVYLENQILRIENELLKLNQSYSALQAENEMLKSRQNKYLALEHKSQEENKAMSLPSNTSEYFELVTVQQEKITLLSELLKNQSSALHNLQSRSDQLEEQNQMLYQIVLNQSALISHVMHKLQEVSEQNLKNQQETSHLKSMMDLQSASNVIDKLEHMLRKDSPKKEKSSGNNIPLQQTLDRSASKLSRDQELIWFHALKFLPKMSEYSSKVKQWKCEGGKKSPRLCLYFSVVISPCPPFKTLSWSKCQHMVGHTETEPVQDFKQHDAMGDRSISNEKDQLPEIPFKTPTSTDTHEMKDTKDDRDMHKVERQAERNKDIPDSVNIPDMKVASKELQETTEKDGNRSANTQSQSDMLPLPISAADGTESENTDKEAEDKTKTPGKETKETGDKNKQQGDTSEQAKKDKKARESEDHKKQSAEKKLESDYNKGSEDERSKNEDTNIFQQLGKSTDQQSQTDGILTKKEQKSSGPVQQSVSDGVKERKAEKTTADSLEMKKQDTYSVKDSSKEQAKTDEERKKIVEAENAKKLKQEADDREKRMQDADTRHLPYWTDDDKKPKDCYDLYKRGSTARNGAYKIFVRGLNLYVSVYCDMKGGGWTILMKREDGSLDFYRGWADYTEGFGAPFGEHYIGNEVIHYLTNQDRYSLQVDLKDWTGNSRTATYRHFWIDDEDHKFKLHILGYSGTAGDGLGKHNGMGFSAKDRDNDLLAKDQMGGSCSRRFHGAGWYYRCYMSNLMGQHYENGLVPEKRFDGVSWKPWTGPGYSLKEAVMKVRPVHAG